MIRQLSRNTSDPNPKKLLEGYCEAAGDCQVAYFPLHFSLLTFYHFHCILSPCPTTLPFRKPMKP